MPQNSSLPGRSRAAHSVALAIALAGVLLVSSPTDSAGFAIDRLSVDCVDDDEDTFQLDTDDVDHHEGRVIDGIENWETVIGRDGDPMVDITPSSGQAVFVITDSSISGNGLVDCVIGVPVILMDTASLSGTRAESTAMHEMGHLLKLMHTGDGEAFGTTGTFPAMSTCLTIAEQEDRILTKDDWANLEFRQTDGSAEIVYANTGFESFWSSGNPKYWSRTNSVTTWSESSIEFSGDSSLRYRPGSDGAKLSSTLAYATGGGEPVDARVRIRQNGVHTGGAVRLEIWARNLTYGTPPPGTGCESSTTRWPTGLNQNDRSVDTFALKRTQNCPHTNGVWASCTETTWFTPGNSVAQGNRDWSLRLYSTLYNSGIPDHVEMFIDEMAIRFRG